MPGSSWLIVFVIQADYGKYFTPNRKTHKEFADALIKAKNQGVKVLCLNCKVGENSLEIDREVEVRV